jgi:hypothetical protein
MIPAVRIYPSSEAASVRTVLEQRSAKGRTYTLAHRTAGVEPMFRASKFASEQWGVTFPDPSNGAINGRWCLTEAEARRLFDLWAPSTVEG